MTLTQFMKIPLHFNLQSIFTSVISSFIKGKEHKSKEMKKRSFPKNFQLVNVVVITK